MKAKVNDTIIAESNNTVVLEGNHYFPIESVHKEFLLDSDTNTSCPWKGQASYYTVKAGGETLEDACWYYPNPKDAAAHIKGHVAFWKGVKVVD